MCKGGAIGVFDSGIGGLTVLRRIIELLPAEPTVYLGDTARVPYGTKSRDTVIRYAHACSEILIGRGARLLVVACNTASAFALDALRDTLDVPVLGVVEPGARRAVEISRGKRIGVIGTAGTIASNAYDSVIRELAPDAEVYSKPCPLFVPLVEEGWTEGPVPEKIAGAYLTGLLDQGIDTLILGCTHYPLLKPTIAKIAGPEVALVDSAGATAQVVAEVLAALGPTDDRAGAALRTYLVSDCPDGFARLGERFLGQTVGAVEWVDF